LNALSVVENSLSGASLPQYCAQALAVCRYALPATMVLFLATAMADAGCYTSSAIAVVRDLYTWEVLVPSKAPAASASKAVGGSEGLTEQSEASAVEGESSQGVGAPVQLDSLRHPLLDKRHWSTILSLITSVFEGYSVYSPMMGNIIGTGNRLQYMLAHMMVLSAAGVGAAISIWQVADTIGDIGVAASIFSWLYAASAFLLLSSMFALGPLLSSLMMIMLQDLPNLWSAMRQRVSGSSDKKLQ
jgi:hypothetical protein